MKRYFMKENYYGLKRGDEIFLKGMSFVDRNDNWIFDKDSINGHSLVLSQESNSNREVDKLIFDEDNKATIVYWIDGTKTVVRCMKGDAFDREYGFAMAYMNKMFGSRSAFVKYIEKNGIEKKGKKNKKEIEYTYEVIESFTNSYTNIEYNRGEILYKYKNDGSIYSKNDDWVCDFNSYTYRRKLKEVTM